MIRRLSLRNFKKFQDLQLEMTALTVLTGVNSGGKSSVVQALLLGHSPRLPWGVVALSGPHGLALGEASDVLHFEARDQQIEIALDGVDTSTRLVLEVPSGRSPTLRVVEDDVRDAFVSTRGGARSFIYLSAERLGPRDLQEVAPDSEDELSVGPRGEFTAHVLSQLDRMQVDAHRRHPDTDTHGGVITLTSQTELWMSSIVCPLRIEADWIPGTSAARLRFKSTDMLTDWLRPANVGFGISYALPIVVAGLTAAPGGLLVVENPESHLHPGGQSAIGRFLARIAAAGTQVVVETHSDHVLNGIRVAAAAETVIHPQEVIVHYFPSSSPVVTLEIDGSGAVSAWPAGFFDQTEEDLTELAHAKRRE